MLVKSWPLASRHLFKINPLASPLCQRHWAPTRRPISYLSNPFIFSKKRLSFPYFLISVLDWQGMYQFFGVDKKFIISCFLVETDAPESESTDLDIWLCYNFSRSQWNWMKVFTFQVLNLFLAKVDDVLGGKPELDTFKRGSDKVSVVFKRGCNKFFRYLLIIFFCL